MPVLPLTVIAPAKINLYLHVTGRCDDGHHLLDSLIVFADVADQITIHPASKFSLAIEGAYAGAFIAADRDDTPQGKNLVVRAAYACAVYFNRCWCWYKYFSAMHTNKVVEYRINPFL